MGTPLDSNHCLHAPRTIVRICVRDGANGAENNGGVGLWWRQKPNNVHQVPMTAASSVLAAQQLRGKSQDSFIIGTFYKQQCRLSNFRQFQKCDFCPPPEQRQNTATLQFFLWAQIILTRGANRRARRCLAVGTGGHNTRQYVTDNRVWLPGMSADTPMCLLFSFLQGCSQRTGEKQVVIHLSSIALEFLHAWVYLWCTNAETEWLWHSCVL